jgi:hypothetical protein
MAYRSKTERVTERPTEWPFAGVQAEPNERTGSLDPFGVRSRPPVRVCKENKERKE